MNINKSSVIHCVQMLDRVNRMKCGMHSVIIIFETPWFNVYLWNNENKKQKQTPKKKKKT